MVVTFLLLSLGIQKSACVSCIYPLNCVFVHLLWEINIACRVFFIFANDKFTKGYCSVA